MKHFFNELLSFTEGEMRALWIILLITTIICGYKVYRLYTRSLQQPIHSTVLVYKAENSEEETTSGESATAANIQHNRTDIVIDNTNIRPFNPNNQPAEFWIQIGLSPKQAGVIKKYEAAGGRFRSHHDVRKMRVISDDVYTRIEPYLLFETVGSVDSRSPETFAIVNINQADSAGFLKLRGIGPHLAGRIVRYRNRIGGFFSPKQLTAVYGVKDSVVQMNAERMDTTGFRPVKLNVNTLSVKELLKVYGMTYESALTIVKHREKNGFFRVVSDLRKFNLVNEELYTKIAPYLTAGLNNP